MGKNVFIIDDDPYILHLLTLSLQDFGHKVIPAATAHEAEEQFKVTKPDFIFLDLILPDADGRTFLKSLRSRPALAAVPIIMLTATIDPTVKGECMALGANDYIQKPFDTKDLKAALAEQLTITLPTNGHAAEAIPLEVITPAPEEDVAEPEEVDEVRTPTGHKLGDIILAEDDELIAGLIKHRLARDGYTVHHYYDGAEALEGAKQHTAVMFILDVKMPQMDGFELLERLRQFPNYAKTPVLILSAMGQEKDIVRGLQLGADDYICKPFSPAELIARVHRYLH